MKKRAQTPNREPSREISEIPAEVAENLGSYVYLYIDPRNGQIKYVGKGKDSRATAHLAYDGKSEKEKTKWIKELDSAGLSPQIDILSRELTEEQAFLVERSVIDALGVESLTNAVRGQGTEQGRESLREIIIREAAKKADIQHPVILFQLNKSFHKNMSEEEIYEATRGIWRIGAKGRDTHRYKYAFGVFKWIVRGVFSIDIWHKGLSTKYKFRPNLHLDEKNKLRWEFTSAGKPPQKILKMYLHKSVRKYCNAQSPFSYAEPTRAQHPKAKPQAL